MIDTAETTTTTIQLTRTQYPAYKDSGVEWLGEIPAPWEVKRIKFLFKEKNVRSITGLEELLSLSKYHGVIPRKEITDKVESANSLVNYKTCSKGDLIINKLQAWNGMLDISKFDGIVSPDYSVYQPLIEDINKAYFKYLFRTSLYIAEFTKGSTGIGDGFFRLYTDGFFRIWSILPPLSEQTRIAVFLDQKTAQIDQAIAQKERLIELLNERRQVMIHQAVTRGLAPNVPMKDSGFDWIGEIPAHWEVAKLGYITSKIGDGLHGTPNYVDQSDFYFINGNNLVKGSIKITDQTKNVSEKEYILHKKFLDDRTLLLSINGTIGNLAFYKNEKIILGKSSAYINFSIGPNSKYMYYFLGSKATSIYFDRQLSGSTINNLSLHSISKTPVFLPPLEEQCSLVKYIEENTLKIDVALNKQYIQIQKLQEFKSTLINSAVTGKIKV